MNLQTKHKGLTTMDKKQIKKWTEEQLKNFFLKETMWCDESCEETAKRLSIDGILNLLIKQNPSDYTKRRY